MHHLTVNRTPAHVLRGVLEAREEFDTKGSLRGGPTTYSTGYLPSRFAHEYNERRGHIDYTVLSYATPIAWHDDEFGWTVPDVQYSTTTSKSQGRVRAAVSEYDTAPRV